MASADNAAASNQQVLMHSQKDCQLAVSFYPHFRYIASGGGGPAEVVSTSGSRLQVRFPTDTLLIPQFNWRTGRLFGAPLPPGINIRIVPDKLEGWLDRATGEVELQFIARFFFSAPFYKPPPMHVTTTLTTGSVKLNNQKGEGKRIDDKGRARLAGVAVVQPTGSWLLDHFLPLPATVKAVMSCEFVLPVVQGKTK